MYEIICKDVSDIKDLSKKELAFLDRLSDVIHNWAISVAATGGMAAGLGGAVTLAADIPATVALALPNFMQADHLDFFKIP